MAQPAASLLNGKSFLTGNSDLNGKSFPPKPSPDLVIGVHDGHNASAALVRDGRVELALQEERFTRVKNQGDAPVHALQAALRLAGQPGDVSESRVALNGLYMNYGQWKRDTILQDYRSSATVASRLKQPLKNTLIDRAYRHKKAQAREHSLGKLGLASERLVPVEHHTAHASAAYYTRPWSQASAAAP